MLAESQCIGTEFFLEFPFSILVILTTAFAQKDFFACFWSKSVLQCGIAVIFYFQEDTLCHRICFRLHAVEPKAFTGFFILWKSLPNTQAAFPCNNSVPKRDLPKAQPTECSTAWWSLDMLYRTVFPANIGLP